MRTWSVSLIALGIVVLALGLALASAGDVGAQSGNDPFAPLATAEAQATLDALNAGQAAGNAQSQAAQAEAQAAALRAQAAQQAAAATRQAAYNADVQARTQATANAVVQATRLAQDAQATAQVMQATATAQAQSLQATATAQAQSAQATAAAISAEVTRQAIDASATRAAYDTQLAAIQKRSDFGTTLLYIAGLLAIAGCAYVVFAWARFAARRFAPAPVPSPAATSATGGTVVIDVTPKLLAGPTSAPEVKRVEPDPRATEMLGAWFDNELEARRRRLANESNQ